MRKILGIIIFFIVLLSITQVVVSNNMATAGVTLAKMEDELKKLKKENAILEEKVFLASSLTKITSDAAKLGFIQAKSPIVISNTVPVAMKQ